MKKLISLILACVMLGCLMAGCQDTAALMAELEGTWVMVGPDSEEQAQSVLEAIDLYEEEIALVDLTTLNCVKSYTFNADGTYVLSEDAEGDRQCVEEFFRAAFEAIYAGRTNLNSVYGTSFDEMSWEQFGQYYANMYGVEDYETMITTFADNAYVYEEIGVLEEGTYEVQKAGMMDLTPTEGDGGYVTYELEGETLTITYSDDVETYTKAG